MRVVVDTNFLVSGVFFSGPPRQILEPFFTLLATNAQIIQPRQLPQTVVSDPSDDKFFACALAADCRIIVSGDRQVLAASGFEGIEVLRPRSFVETYL